MDSLPIGAAASLLGMEVEAFTKALKNGENDLAPEKIGERCKELGSKALKDSHDTGHRGAKKAVLTEAEKTLRRKFGIPEDIAGEFETLLDYAVEQASKRAPDMKPEDIRQHQVYLDDIKGLKEKEKALQKEFSQFQGEARKELALNRLHQVSPAVLKKAGFLVPDDPVVQSTLFGALLTIIEAENNVEIKRVGGEYVPIDVESGEPLTGDQSKGYRPVGLAELIQKAAPKVFIKEQRGNAGPGNQGEEGAGAEGEGGGGAGQGADFPPTKTTEEFFRNMAKMREDGVKPEVREAYRKHFEALKAAGKIDKE